MPIGFELPLAEVALSAEDRYAQFLRSQGKRFTSQKRIILEVIFSHHDHFDVEELLEHLREPIVRGGVSRPTVYRVLSELVEAGILRRMQVQLNGRALYEHDYACPHHDHLVCQVCHQLIEFHSDELDEIGRTAAKECRFTIHDRRMVIMGICHECSKNEVPESSSNW